jgi:uncharacterized protein (DUF1330 family)
MQEKQEKAVFVVVEVVSIKDPKGFGEYISRVPELMASYGGEILGRGGEGVEGEERFSTLVVERWPSAEAFRTMLKSEAYQPLSKIRHASCVMRVVIIPMSARPDA